MTITSGSSDTKDEAVAKVKEGDKLTLYTALMSISLFLLGVSALERQARTQFVLIGTSVAIFGVSAVLALFIPYMAI